MATNEIPSRAALFLAAVGEQILTYRETAGMTVEQLAEKICMTAAELDRLEHGWLDIDLSKLQAIADVFGVTAAELLDVRGTELGLSF